MSHGLIIYILVSVYFVVISWLFFVEAKKINTQLGTIIRILKKQKGP